MNITFICGTLEPGKDGVGDYTLRLAEELNCRNHTASVLALCDYYINDNEEHRELRLGNISVLRVSAELSYNQRYVLARNWIEQQNPSWLSLQFVNFAFQQKGLPYPLKSLLGKLGKGRQWHIMFHELWVGMAAGASTKHVLWGWLQEKLIEGLIDKLRPAVIHTQCLLYQAQLSRLGANVSYLPLYSNIPNFQDRGLVDDCKNHTRDVQSAMPNPITFIVFGTIHPETYLSTFIHQLLTFSKKLNVVVKLVLIGKNGAYQDRWVSTFRSRGIEVEVLGEQSPKTISDQLNRANVGVSTSAPPLIDKSGTVAAMHAHNLPVICVGHNWKPRKVQVPFTFRGVYLLTDGSIESCLNSRLSAEHEASPSTIVEKLINDLSKNHTS